MRMLIPYIVNCLVFGRPRAMNIWKILNCFYSILCCATFVNAGESFPTCAGPAMGTTYRFTLTAPIPEKSLGEVHREIDLLLQQIDTSLSTWRDDSLATKLNQADAYTPIQLDFHLTNILTIAEELSEQTQGQFDITAAPLIQWWHQFINAASTSNKLKPAAAPTDVMNLIGFKNLMIKKPIDSDYPLVQKTHANVAIDLSGIGAGYAVDQIGEHLVSIGSSSHLVELGGEVRAWGQPSPSGKWLVTIRETKNMPSKVIALDHGQALAVSTTLPEKPIVDPTTGRLLEFPTRGYAVVAYAPTCAEADALATSYVIDAINKKNQERITPD